MRPLDRRTAELDGLRAERLQGRSRLGSRTPEPAAPVPPEEQPNDGFIEVLAGDAFPNQGNIVPGGGNSIGYEDLKLIEALAFLRSNNVQPRIASSTGADKRAFEIGEVANPSTVYIQCYR